jgi:hypothetical protein
MPQPRKNGDRAGRTTAAMLALLVLVLVPGLGTGLVSGAAPRAATVTPPDMRLLVLTDAISIGLDPATGHRLLRYSHVTADSGAGPFEIDPTYDPETGTATFTQAIYSSSAPGVWSLDHRVPLPVVGVFDPPAEYQFPLNAFTLHAIDADGSAGAVVASSPKSDYCITGDYFVGDAPVSPDHTFIPADNCTDPTKPLGWSPGWGDHYDQVDDGQPIDLGAVPDGRYILRGIVDPRHLLTESDATNNVTDTVLTISGNAVTVGAQTHPDLGLPSVRMTAPAAGAVVSGTVTLAAAAQATPPATVRSVQFLLDGDPLGRPVTAAPYTTAWTVGSTTPGVHHLSAQVTDSRATLNTAAAVAVTVKAAPPDGSSASGDTTPPTVAISNPVAGQTLSGTVRVAARTHDDVAMRSVQFLLDGQALGAPDTTAPYATTWRTTRATAGRHTLSARATDTAGNVGRAAGVPVRVRNPAAPMTCFVVQAKVSVHGHGTVRTRPIHTAMAGEVLLALVAADGPARARAQTARVSGAGLTWRRVRRANAQYGDAEIWTARTRRVLTAARIRSSLARSGYDQSLTVLAMAGATGTGASAARSGATGPPSVRVRITGPAASLVFAVGNDWDRSVPRRLPRGQILADQWLDRATGDTFWSQYTNHALSPAGTVVSMRATTPTTDRWNMAAVELVGDRD